MTFGTFLVGLHVCEFWSVSPRADYPAEPPHSKTVLTLELIQIRIKLSIGACRSAAGVFYG